MRVRLWSLMRSTRFLDDDERRARDALHRLLNDHLPRQRSTVFATASVDAPQRLPGDLLRRRWATRPVQYLSSERGMPTIQHTLVLCPKPEARLAVLRQFLKGVKTATVVFFDEKRLSLLPKIAAALKQDDLRVDVLNEADDLESRSSAFEAFVRGEVDVLLTTDLAARGLDAPRTSLVVNFDVPRTATDYLHRAGRTAQLGRSGAVLTICEKSPEVRARAVREQARRGHRRSRGGFEAYARLAGVGETCVLCVSRRWRRWEAASPPEFFAASVLQAASSAPRRASLSRAAQLAVLA